MFSYSYSESGDNVSTLYNIIVFVAAFIISGIVLYTITVIQGMDLLKMLFVYWVLIEPFYE